MRWRAGLGAVLAASAFLVPAATTAQAEQIRTFTVWDWNISGNLIHDGSTTNGIVRESVDSIIESDADFASFNEICWGQYKAIQTSLAAKGWPASADFSRFAATRDPHDEICDGSETFGQALFSREALGSSRQYVLPWDGKLGTRKLLCAPLRASPLMKFCTVHITTQTLVPPDSPPGAPDAKTQQLNHMLDLLNGFHDAGEAYIVAGDFNAQPDYGRLNGYYSPTANTVNNPNNTGTHRELDDADPANCPGYGEWTADDPPTTLPPCPGMSKVDLIMARESRIVGAYTADALDIPTTCVGVVQCADHRILVGTVTLTIP